MYVGSKIEVPMDIQNSKGMNGLNIRTNASPKWDRTRCQEEGRITDYRIYLFNDQNDLARQCFKFDDRIVNNPSSEEKGDFFFTNNVTRHNASTNVTESETVRGLKPLPYIFRHN